MGFFDKVSGTDARYSKYRKVAETALQALISHSESVGRDFNKIMLIEDNIPGMRVSAYLAGYVAMIFENNVFNNIKNYKSRTIARAVKDTVDEAGYDGYDMDLIFLDVLPGMLEKGEDDLAARMLKQIVFMIPGGIVAQKVMDRNKEDVLFNMTICLDTMMMESPAYDANGHSNHKDYL